MNKLTAAQVDNITSFVRRVQNKLTFTLEGPGISYEAADTVWLRADLDGLSEGNTGFIEFKIDGRTSIEITIRQASFGQPGHQVEISHPSSSSNGLTVAGMRLKAKVFTVAADLAAGIEETITAEVK